MPIHIKKVMVHPYNSTVGSVLFQAYLVLTFEKSGQLPFKLILVVNFCEKIVLSRNIYNVTFSLPLYKVYSSCWC